MLMVALKHFVKYFLNKKTAYGHQWNKLSCEVTQYET